MEKKILFGKYETGRQLGKGTFAKVFHATNLATGENVAIKVIKKEIVKSQAMMEQIKREISGGELFAKVAKGRLKEDVARKYFQQLISAVEFCHSCGVSHLARVNGSTLRLQGSCDSRPKARLLVNIEVFKVAPEVAVVKFSKISGDSQEYTKFFEEEVKPNLKDIVLTWHVEQVLSDICEKEDCKIPIKCASCKDLTQNKLQEIDDITANLSSSV
ncbi:hypothetical protein MTR67_051721 [Solanum verrucosum]|uniref:Protein kinase domain-containing protein n=1 Tax=Solanum verrucosum TaxID=315347 RepID=A0AAF1A0D7_SOLVR|nr:hypothetical protein MTR67_051721 [Solanum verrucosum]